MSKLSEALFKVAALPALSTHQLPTITRTDAV
jgi:hypothetical protein